MKRSAVLSPEDPNCPYVVAVFDDVDDDRIYNSGVVQGDYYIADVPSYVEIEWRLILGVYCSPDEYTYWKENLKGKGLPPRTPDQIKEDRLDK